MPNETVEATTVKELRCRDAGFDCDAVAQGQTTDEVMQQVGPHARDVHHIDVTPDMEHLLSGLVRDV